MIKIPGIVRKGLIGLNTVYALVDSADCIFDHDPLFPIWILEGEETPVKGISLFEVVPEFVGQEAELERVRQGERTYLRIEHCGRMMPDGKLRYLTLTVVPGDPNAGISLMILVTDTTEQGQHLQELTQNRNELRLTRRKLAKLTYQLDYLLRHYVPGGVADALLQEDLQPERGGELREVSILFADVRGFTSLSEQLSPWDLMEHLNGYLHVVADSISEMDGTISQFQGDNLIVIFNAPLDQDDHALRAVQAGVKLQQAILNYQSEQPPQDARLNFGVGINTGMAFVGNVGAQWRYSYTALGDTVNLAARITGAAPAGEIWISQSTQAQLPDTVTTEPLPTMTFRGKSQSTELYRVINVPAV